MKDKPPFILFSNKSKSLNSRVQSSIKFKSNINLTFKRIPKEILKNSAELRKIVFKERKPVYDVINLSKKPSEIKISNDMSDQTQKNLENINLFRENFYEFNVDERKLNGKISLVKQENDRFGNQYHKIERIKNRLKSGTYLDYDYLIPIANKYYSKGIKSPKINSGKSIFSGSPLILSGSELEDFIVYHLGDRNKGIKFLHRIEKIVDKKEKGNFILGQSGMKNKMDDDPEDIKGYIPPEILIPKLEKEIQDSKKTLDNIKDFELFFQKKKRKFNLFYKLESAKNKIRINKNLPLIKKLNINNMLDSNNKKNNNNENNNKENNNNENNNNENNNNSNKDNNLSIGYLSPISHKNTFNKVDLSTENRILGNDKSTLFIFSKLPPNNHHHKKRFSVVSNFGYENIKRRNSNLSNINFFGNNIKRRFTNSNTHNNLKGFLQNNSTDTKNNILSCNNSFLNYSKDEKQHEKINNYQKRKNQFEIIRDSYYKSRKKENLYLNLSDNYNLFTPKKENKINLKQSQKIFDKNKDEENLLKTEKIFNLVLEDKNLYRNRNKIIKYLNERGYNTSKNINSQELYKNFDNAEKRMHRNILQEEYKMRGDFINTRYKNLMEKDKNFSMQIEENTSKYKKMLIEKSFDIVGD